ncbi:MAG: hypothetical protein M1268_01245 [Patescibacteria group bacterium]|nr:hypothetical protein [Patescibacteria group bacterium]
MKLPALFAIQFLIIILLAGTSIKSQQAQIARHSLKQVLGARYIAQEVQPENPPPDQTSPPDTTQPQQTQNSDSNAPNTTPDAPTNTGNSQEQTQPSPSDQTTPTTQSVQQPSDQPLQTDETSLINQNPTPIEGQSAQITPPPIITVEQQTSDSQQRNMQEIVDTTSENNASSLINLPVIDFEATIAEPKTIDTAIIDKVDQEDKQLQETKDPQRQTETLINFAKNKTVDLNRTISKNDFSTTSFLIQRLSDQIDKAQENLQQMDIIKRTLVEKQLKIFCKQADLGLKTEQLIVPEELEQDFEIARGSCLVTQ